MSGTMNKVILIGRLGRDPEIRTFQNGGRVANIRLATSETWKDRNTGERQERTEWHSVAVFNDGLVRIVEQYARKGDLISIEGKLVTRKWQDQSGQDRYSTEIHLQGYGASLGLLSNSRGGGDGQGGGYGGGQGGQGQGASSRDLDDEIPF
jgi:single-strand DNA-binding protein